MVRGVATRRETLAHAIFAITVLFERDWFYFGHLSHKEFAVLKNVFPEAVVEEEGEHVNLSFHLGDVIVEATTFGETYSPDGVRLYREDKQ